MHDHVTNVLGAFALSVSDLLTSGAAATAGTSTSGAAALAVLSQADPLGVSELGRRVGLTQPAAARMIDSLEQRGLVARHRGPGRQTTVVLTPAGTRAARTVLDDRTTRLTPLLAGLTGDEQLTLAELIDRLLRAVYEQVGDADLVCRLCDRGDCTDAGRPCPVGAAHRERQRGQHDA